MNIKPNKYSAFEDVNSSSPFSRIEELADYVCEREEYVAKEVGIDVFDVNALMALRSVASFSIIYENHTTAKELYDKFSEAVKEKGSQVKFGYEDALRTMLSSSDDDFIGFYDKFNFNAIDTWTTLIIGSFLMLRGHLKSEGEVVEEKDYKYIDDVVCKRNFNPATDSMDDYLLELVTNACYEAKTRSWSVASLIIVRAFLKLTEQLSVPCFGLMMQANDRVNILINNTPEEVDVDDED
jgi:hypothetical protein|nr:MAG TPA: hypothetical protein [Caudoviricetes sp.]